MLRSLVVQCPETLGSMSLALGPDRAIYFTDSHAGRIYCYRDAELIHLAGNAESSPTLGCIDGHGRSARFSNPGSVAVDANGDLIIADVDNAQIRRMRRNAPFIVDTLAGDGNPGYMDGCGSTARFWAPSGVAACADRSVIVADAVDHRIRKISADGSVNTLAGSGVEIYGGFADGPAAAARFNGPTGVAVCPDHSIIVCDTHNNRIRRISPAGVVSTLAGSGEPGSTNAVTGALATFDRPGSIAVDENGHAVVGEQGGSIRKIVIATGEVTEVASHLGESCPCVAIDVDGTILFAGVLAVLLVVRQAQDGFGGWLRFAPILPPEIWLLIIGMIPCHAIGRVPGAVPEQDLTVDAWINQQMQVAAAGHWGPSRSTRSGTSGRSG